ncbi:UNVERIFIED_CONTAM: RHS repeat-associated protein [Acetivibrio alkalicellulosi]
MDIEDHGHNGKLIKVMLPQGEINYFVDKNGSFTSKGTRNKLSLESGIYVLTTKNQEKFGYELYETNKYRIRWMRDRYGNQLDFSYDTSKRLNRISDSMGNIISVAYTANKIDVTHTKSSRTVSYVLEGGLLKEIIDPMKIKTTFSYDSNKCLVKVWDNNGELIDSLKYKKNSSGKYVVDTYIDAFGSEKEYTYYENENKTVVGEKILSGRVFQIAAGGSHALALKEDGTVMAWGSNGNGQLGLGDTTIRTTPTKIVGLNNVKQIAAGGTQTLALMEDGTVMAWGSNRNGELGLGDTTERNKPTPIYGLNNVKQIAAGFSHALALMEDGTVMAWGSNGSGELGLGDTTIRTTPTLINGLNNIKQIAAGVSYTLALKEDGTVMAWGSNGFGQLGLGDRTRRITPILINGLNNVKQISAGARHTIALKEDGTVMIWGCNMYAELGLGDHVDRTTPIPLDGLNERLIGGISIQWIGDVDRLNNVKQVVGGAHHTVALMEDGTVMAWGRNGDGELGVGENVERSTTPSFVKELSNVKQISTRGFHTLALKEDGTVVAWGSNGSGQLGLGDTTTRYTPTTVTSLSSTTTNLSSFEKTTTYLHKDYRVTEIIDSLKKSTYYSYNNFGELESYTDRNGNKTQYIINQSTGNVENIINPDLSKKEFGYDSKNNLIWEKDEEGFFTRYVYDNDGINLRKKARYMEKVGVNQVVDFTEQNASKFAITEYQPYTNSNNIKLKGVVHKIIDPLGNTTTYYHYEDGSIKEIWGPEEENKNPEVIPKKYTYNNMGLIEHEYSSRNHRTDYKYNANGQIESIVVNNADGVNATITESSTLKVGYDKMGRMNHKLSPRDFSERFPEAHSNSGYRYEYHKSGKVQKEIDAENNVTMYTYDQFGNLKTKKRHNGSVYNYEYDLLNRLIKVYFQEYESYGKKLLEEYTYPEVTLFDKIDNYYETKMIHREYFSDSDYAQTRYYYDYAGRLSIKELPDNTSIENMYYKNGSLNWYRDGRGNSTYFSYGKYDSSLNTTYDEVWNPSVNEKGTVKYSYERVDYDKAGRKVLESTGKSFVNQGEPSDCITYKYSYYNSGKLKSIAHKGELLKEYKYDVDWNLIEEIHYKESSVITNPKRSIIKYENIDYLGKPKEKVFITESNNIILKLGDNSKTYSQYPGSIGLVTTYTYDKNGNIKTETAPNGLTTTYNYDMMNRLKLASQPATDEYGKVTIARVETRYNWEGKVEYTKDANGNETEYIYNQRGLLEKTKTSVKRDNEKTDIISAYQYDRAGRLIAEVEPKNYTLGIDPLDTTNRIEYTYDKMGRLKTKEFVGKEMQVYPQGGFSWIEMPVRTVQKAYKYDINGNLVKELDALGYATGNGNSVDQKIENGYGTEYTYTLNNLVETVLDPESKLKGLEYSVKYKYDSLGRKTHNINVKGSDLGNKFETITTYKYNDLGNIEFVLVDNDIIQRNSYDFLGNIMSQTDANNNITTYSYNALNQNTQVVYSDDESIDSNTDTYWYDVVGNLVKQKNSLNNVRLNTYDNQGRLLTHTSQKGEGVNANEIITKSVKYDLNGNKRFEVDGNGYKKEYIYDELNRLSQIRSENITTEEGRLVNHITAYKYDLNGNVELTIETVENGTNSISKTYKNLYDPLNRLIEKRNPDDVAFEKLEYNISNAQVRSYDALNNMTSYNYDRNSRLIETIDAEDKLTTQGYDLAGNIGYKEDGRNNKTIYTYDKFDRLEKVEGLEAGKTARKLLSSYTYDLNGNMETQTDGKGNTITYEYNSRNLLSKRIDPDGRIGEKGSYTYDNTKLEWYKYYGDGSLKEKTDKKSIKTTYTYDIHGRLKSQNTNGANKVSINYTYDNNGNSLTVSTGSEVISRTYDEINRAKTKTVTSVGQSKFEYDIIYDTANGFIGERSIDPKGNKTTKVYDRVGRLKYVKNGDVNSTVYTTYNYNANGSRESVTYPNGSKSVYTYYDNNLLWTLTNKRSNGSNMDVYTYTYDKANNQNSKHEIINGVNKGTTNYTYDYLNRLESVSESNGRKTVYEYDGAGNRETESITHGSTQTVKTYVYNKQNWLQSITTSVGGNTVLTDSFTYTYDNNGNQTHVRRASNNSVVSQNTYNDLNQLIRSNANGKIVENTYNGEGLRVTKSANDSLTRYLYEYDKVVLEVNSSGQQIARNIYGTNLLMRQADGMTLYYMYNGHADVTALIDTNGVIRATYYYDAFGNVMEEQYFTASGTPTLTPINNSIMYAGYQYDRETELYYLNARMYDPKIARFLQEDTYRGSIHDPLSLNLYSYCANNPIRYYDPTGHYYVKVQDGKNTYNIHVSEYYTSKYYRKLRIEHYSGTHYNNDILNLDPFKESREKLYASVINAKENPKDALVGAGHNLVNKAGEFAKHFNSSWYHSTNANYLGDFTFSFFSSKQKGFTKNVVENYVDDIEAFEFGNTVVDAAMMAKGLKDLYNIGSNFHRYGVKLPYTQSIPKINPDGTIVIANETVQVTTASGQLIKRGSILFASSGGGGNPPNINKRTGNGGSKSNIPVKDKTTASNGLDYQSNSKHTLGQPGNRPNAGIEPKNSLDLFGESTPSTQYPELRFTFDIETNTLHRFFNNGNGTWHWSGSTNQGVNSLTGSQVPIDIKRLFNMPKKGW